MTKLHTSSKVTFQCEVITPMFMAGVDQSKPELRPPSIKGLMRFWWRALHGHLSSEDLWEQEKPIFGGIGGGGQKSKFSIRVTDKSNMKPQRANFPEKRSNPGLSYLWFPMYAGWRENYFKADSTFRIKFLSEKTDKLTKAIHSFFALGFFGSLGARSRRGAGSIWIKNLYDEKNLPDEISTFCKDILDTSAVEDKKEVEYLLNKLDNRLFGDQEDINDSYSTLKGGKVFILNPKNCWESALNTLGKSYRSFRSANRSRISETPNFGFPIIHRKSKTNMGAGPKNYKLDKRKNVKGFLDRRGSPLIFKVLKTGKGLYFPMILWLRGKLIPSDYKIMDKKGSHIAKPNEEIINEFLKTVKTEEELVEVSL